MFLAVHIQRLATDTRLLDGVLRLAFAVGLQTGRHEAVQAASGSAGTCENTKHASQSGGR